MTYDEALRILAGRGNEPQQALYGLAYLERLAGVGGTNIPLPRAWGLTDEEGAAVRGGVDKLAERVVEGRGGG